MQAKITTVSEPPRVNPQKHQFPARAFIGFLQQIAKLYNIHKKSLLFIFLVAYRSYAETLMLSGYMVTPLIPKATKI